MVKVNF